MTLLLLCAFLLLLGGALLFFLPLLLLTSSGETGLFMWTISDSTGKGNIGIKSVIKSVANPSFFRTNFDEQFSELLY